MTTSTTWTAADLFERVDAILRRGGLCPVQAAAMARTIVAGERDACKSHGIYRIEGVLRTVKAGAVVVDAEPETVPHPMQAIVKVDGKGGFANASLELGVPLLADRATSCGLAALAINNVVHFSALWNEVEAVVAKGLVCLAMCPSYATVAPAGGSKPLLGTNPFAFGWPREGAPPYVFDFATSVAARGEIELHRRAGTRLPEGWAIDADGRPTTDPVAALKGAMLSFGGHKGSAIGTMIELLAGALIGDLTSTEALALTGTATLLPRHGELVIAFSPEAFSDRAAAQARAETLFRDIVDQGARLPSQRRFLARAKSDRDGIALTAAEVAQLDAFLEKGLDAV